MRFTMQGSTEQTRDALIGALDLLVVPCTYLCGGSLSGTVDVAFVIPACT